MVSAKGGVGRPYGVVGGRSNRRWWFIPLNDRRTTASAWALFQPMVPSAKLLKRAAIMAGSLGLSLIYRGKQIGISGGNELTEIFGGESLAYAFFTGTDSPHRKAAIQIMDLAGNIKGFAKVSRNPVVSELLRREAETLRYLQSLNLRTAATPRVLFSGPINGAEVLVTDTLKTNHSRMPTKFQAAHLGFLCELAEKSVSIPSRDNPVTLLARSLGRVEGHISADWRRRLSSAIQSLAVPGTNLGRLSLSHGDFTPWNTFIADDRLYVFDWEYAASGQPFGGDILHFLLAQPNARRSIRATVRTLSASLSRCGGVIDAAFVRNLLLYYCCWRSLHYISREPSDRLCLNKWDCAQDMAVLLDFVLSGNG